MTVVESDSEEYRLLYCDEAGNRIGLEEVQLLDPVPAARLESMRAILHNGDVTSRWHSLLVLIAWGAPEGLRGARSFLEGGDSEVQGISTHRIYGYDLAHDELANSLVIALDRRAFPSSELSEIARHLLKLFRTIRFDTGLVALLSGLADPKLERDIFEAIQSVNAEGRIREASDLLPALASTNPELAEQTISDLFIGEDGLLPEALTGVAFTLGRVGTAEALSQLRLIGESGYPGAAVAAESALRLHRLS